MKMRKALRFLAWLGFGLIVLFLAAYISLVIYFRYTITEGVQQVSPCTESKPVASRLQFQERIVKSLLPSIRVFKIEWLKADEYKSNTTDDEKALGSGRDPSGPQAFASYEDFMSANPDCCTFEPMIGDDLFKPNESEYKKGWTDSVTIGWRDKYFDRNQKPEIFKKKTNGRLFLLSNCGDTVEKFLD
jgi:hypothetical protein